MQRTKETIRKGLKRAKKSLSWLQKITAVGALVAATLVLVTLLVGLHVAGEIYDYQDTFDGVRLPQVDAIVCLAGGRGRIDVAADVWYRYHEVQEYQDPAAHSLPFLYFAGLGPQASWSVIVPQVRRGIRAKLQREHVVIENQSTNTFANAQWFAQEARKRGWKRVLLVTSSYHMRRAYMIFKHVLDMSGLPMGLETYSVFQEPFTSEEWTSGPNGIRVTFMEYIKLVYYRYRLSRIQGLAKATL